MKTNQSFSFLAVVYLILFSGSSPAQQMVNSVSLGKLSKSEISQMFGGVVKVDFGVRLIKINYSTPDVYGLTDTASGLLAVPDVSTGKFPFLVFQRGAIDNRQDVPSNLMDAWQSTAIAAGLGYVAISPDLLGVGDSRGFHPYLHADTETSAALDMLFAVQSYLEGGSIKLNNQWFVAGYSQGGHSAMALHRELETNHPSFPVTAAAHMSGPYSLSVVMRNLILGDDPYPFPGFIANLLLSHNYVYQWYDSLEQLFKPQFVGPINQFFQGQIGFFQLDTLLLTTLRKDFGKDYPKLMLQDSVVSALVSDSLHPINEALRKNDTYDWAPAAPTRLFYCSGDDRVKYTNSTFADSVMRMKGARDIQAIDISPSLDHRQCIQPSALFAIIFFENYKSVTSAAEVAQIPLSIELFPNPAKLGFTLKGLHGPSSVYIFDLNGGMIWRGKVFGSEQTIDAGRLKPGMYVVRVEGLGGFWTGKLVIRP